MKRVESRIEELLELQAGWLDGRAGEQLSRKDAEWARELFIRLMVDDGLPMPYLYPTAEGGLRAEWTRSPWELSVDLSLATRKAWAHAADLNTDNEREEEFDLTQEDGEDRLKSFLTEILPTSSEREV